MCTAWAWTGRGTETGGGSIGLGQGGISQGQSGEAGAAGNVSEGALEGTFALELGKDYTVSFRINSQGTASYETEPIFLEKEIVGSAVGFLEEFREMELDEEAPVAVMAYDSGTRMRSFSTEDYFEPSKFEGIDLVQAVTLEFTSGETAGEQPAPAAAGVTVMRRQTPALWREWLSMSQARSSGGRKNGSFSSGLRRTW